MGFFEGLGGFFKNIGSGGGGFMGDFGTGGGALSKFKPFANVGKGGDNFMGKFGTGGGLLGGIGKGGEGFMGKFGSGGQGALGQMSPFSHMGEGKGLFGKEGGFGSGQGALSNMFNKNKAPGESFAPDDMFSPGDPVSEGVSDYNARFESSDNAVGSGVDDYNNRFYGDGSSSMPADMIGDASSGVDAYNDRFVDSSEYPASSDWESRFEDGGVSDGVSDYNSRFEGPQGGGDVNSGVSDYEARFKGPNAHSTPQDSMVAASGDNVNQWGVDESIYNPVTSSDGGSGSVNQFGVDESIYDPVTSNSSGGNTNQFGVDMSIYNPASGSTSNNSGSNVNQFGVDMSIYNTPQGSGDRATNATDEDWDWEQDEHDAALDDFYGMSDEDQRKQIKKNKRRVWLNNKWVKRAMTGLAASQLGGGGSGQLAGAISDLSGPPQLESKEYDFADVTGGTGSTGSYPGEELFRHGLAGFYNQNNKLV